MGFWGIPISVKDVRTNPTNTDISTADTIQQMIALAKSASSSPEVCHVVNSLLLNLPNNHSITDLVRAIYWWVKNNVQFEDDETILAGVLGYPQVDKDLLISPQVLLNMPKPMGDCDDFSMLTLALLICAHIQGRFVTIAADPTTPDKFSHVYVEAIVGGRSIVMDTSHGSFCGWEYSQGRRRTVWNVA